MSFLIEMFRVCSFGDVMVLLFLFMCGLFALRRKKCRRKKCRFSCSDCLLPKKD